MKITGMLKPTNNNGKHKNRFDLESGYQPTSSGYQSINGGRQKVENGIPKNIYVWIGFPAHTAKRGRPRETPGNADPFTVLTPT